MQSEGRDCQVRWGKKQDPVIQYMQKKHFGLKETNRLNVKDE